MSIILIMSTSKRFSNIPEKKTLLLRKTRCEDMEKTIGTVQLAKRDD